MLKQKYKKIRIVPFAGMVLSCLVLAIATYYYAGPAKADQFDNQIQALQDQNNSSQALSDQLAATASSYQDAVYKLQAEINGLQQSIVDGQNKSDQLQKQIEAEEVELVKEKKTLGEDIKAMYLDGDISTLEILASSNSLGDFIDKEQYRTSVQTKLKTSVDKINILKAQLVSQQKELQARIVDLKNQRAQKDAAQADVDQKLAFTEGQKASYDQEIKANQAKIVSLRAQQLAANRRFLGSGVNIVYGGSCGGGYPADAVGPYGHWGCNYGQDNTLDNWGMFNRECVSYTAWKVYQTYGYMPYWGGTGNANQWPGDAAAANITTSTIPKVHSVAIGINPNYFGAVGHAMWVEAVNGDGTILVSQYNFGAAGQYSEMTINGAGLTYIYFGG